MFDRKKYLEKILEEKDSHFIKVITGIRRIGKSTLLNQVRTKFNQNFIIYNFNDARIVKKYKWETLLNEIESKANAFKTNYVFLDEIQEIKDFEKCIITLFEHQNLKFDIYLTGSNSHMFSSELITLFTGRTYELTLFPFSFKEIIENNIINSEWELNKKFEYYIMHGGMGIIIDRYNNSEKVFEILKSVYDSIFTKDLMNRHHIKNIDSITKIAKFIFNHIGRNISANNLENYLVSNKEIKISKVTILNYFMWLNQIFLTTKINYYDIKGKKILQTKFKYYATDLGILSINTSFNVMDNYGYRLENLILLKFLEEGWKVYTGNDRYGNEIDFIIEKNFIKKYIQVCDELNENNYLRESRSLLSVNDGYEKIILCMKNNKAREDDGIKIINIVEWILK